jgi:hypothetical protein
MKEGKIRFYRRQLQRITVSLRIILTFSSRMKEESRTTSVIDDVGLAPALSHKRLS